MPTVSTKNYKSIINVIPSDGALGADVVGQDLSKNISDNTKEAILKAWADYIVLRFRGQTLDDLKLLRFAKLFGETDIPERTKKGDPWIPEFPELTVISNVVENGISIGGLGSSEAQWHSDMTYRDVPPKASILYALEVPDRGIGNTSFANMYQAYENLPENVKHQILGLKIKHDASTNSAGETRIKTVAPRNSMEAPGAVHPIVKVHPQTGRRALFLGRRLNAYVVGLPISDSERLLDILWDVAQSGDNIWTQEWELGDLIIWDNRCAIHRRDSFDSNVRRIMHRVQVKDVPTL